VERWRAGMCGHKNKVAVKLPSLLPHSMLPEHAYTLWNAGGLGYVAIKTRWLLELGHKARCHCSYM